MGSSDFNGTTSYLRASIPSVDGTLGLTKIGWFIYDTAGEGTVGRFFDNGGGGNYLAINGAVTTWGARILHASTHATTATSAPTFAASQWYVACLTYDPTDKKVRIYYGTPSQPMTECSYSSQVAGVGAFSAMSGSTYVGAESTTPADTFDGRALHPAIVNWVMTYAEMERYRLGNMPVLFARGLPHLYFSCDGANATVDASRRNLTVLTSGVSASSEMPAGIVFDWDWARGNPLRRPVAAPAVPLPAQPRQLVVTQGAAQASVAFIAPTGQLLLAELFPGASGAPSANWTTSVGGAGTIALDTDRLKITVGTNVTPDIARALLIDLAPADHEIAGQITLTTDVNSGVGVSIRGSGSWVAGETYPTTGHLLTISPSVDQMKAWRIDASTPTTLITGTLGDTHINANEPTTFRVGGTGSTVQMKAWNNAADVEPAYSTSTSQTAYQAQTRIGIALRAQSVNAVVGYYDNIYVSNFTSPSIDLYRVTLTPVGGGTTYSNTGASSPIIVTGVPNGNYTATVEAHNAGGWGPASFSSPAFAVSAFPTPRLIRV